MPLPHTNITAQVREKRAIGIWLYYLILGPVLLALGGAILWFYVFKSDPETQAVRDVIERARRAVEAADLDAAMALLHPEYSDSFGNTYERVRREAQRELNRVSDISLRFRRFEITVSGRRAEARFQMAAQGSYTNAMGQRFPINGVTSKRPKIFGANWENVYIVLEKEQGRWLVSRVEVRAAS
jgi:hypothetical protein